MRTCDRNEFMMWVSGIVLENVEGRVRACSEAAARDAEAEINAGGTVYLTVHGRVVSTISLAPGSGSVVEKAYVQL